MNSNLISIFHLLFAFEPRAYAVSNSFGSVGSNPILTRILRTSSGRTYWIPARARERDEYDVKVAEAREEITKLLEAGFEWIGQDNDGLTYFRKRK